MARAHYVNHVIDAEGRPLTGASVYLYDQGTANAIAATIYTVDDSVGSTSTTNPLTTDSSGKVEFYLAAETRLDLKVSKTGYQDRTVTVDALKVPVGGGGGASAIDDLTDVTITAAASGDFLRHNGSAWVDAALSDSDIPAAIARDAEVTSAIATHEADTTNVHGIADTTIVLTTTTGIAKSIVDAKGDLILGTAADTVARQAVGADDTILVAASGQTNGVQWRAPYGKELGYAEKTAAQTGVGTTATDLTSLSVTVTVGSKPILITGFINWQKKTSASYVDLEIYDNTAGARVALTEFSASTDEFASSFVQVRENPAAGSRTYKLRGRAGAATVDFAADATYPAFIHVVELDT